MPGIYFMLDFAHWATENHSVSHVPINSCRWSAVQAMYSGYILSELKFSVDLEHSITRDWQEYRHAWPLESGGKEPRCKYSD